MTDDARLMQLIDETRDGSLLDLNGETFTLARTLTRQPAGTSLHPPRGVGGLFSFSRQIGTFTRRGGRNGSP